MGMDMQMNHKRSFLCNQDSWDTGQNSARHVIVDRSCPSTGLLCRDLRVPLTFEDPKAFDNTPQQAEKYRERSLQIATELLYVFSNLNS